MTVASNQTTFYGGYKSAHPGHNVQKVLHFILGKDVNTMRNMRSDVF